MFALELKKNDISDFAYDISDFAHDVSDFAHDGSDVVQNLGFLRNNIYRLASLVVFTASKS